MDGTFVRRAAVRLAAVAALSSLLATHAAAQTTGTIRGQVTDAVTMRPLSGVQVSVPGTGRGGLANASGQFLVLNVPVGVQSVRAELIGYATLNQQVTVVAGQAAVLDFKLTQTALELDAIIVTGTPGQTQKRAIGNVVSKVEASKVTESMAVPNFAELLQARTPGLTLLSNGGGAGDGQAIRLRGTGSMSGRFEPVVFIDGVRIESGTQSGGGCGNGVHCPSALESLNPNDIESVEVIKGPAASTLYGAEAASGVIQILTKKGRSGSGIQWSGSIDAGTTDWHLARPTTWWTCTAANIASTTYPGCKGKNPGDIVSFRPLDEHPNALRGNKASSYYPNVVPADENGAGQYNVNLSARGGGELFNYFVSAEKADEQGIMVNNFSNRTGGRANFGITPSQELNFNINVGYTRTHIKLPLSNNASNSVLRNAYRAKADVNYAWEPGFLGFGPELANQFDLQARDERYIIGATVNYNPLPWFSNRLVLGLDNQNRRTSEFYMIDQTGRAPWGATSSLGYIQHQIRPIHNWTLDYSGTVSTDIGENYSSAFSAGMQINARKAETFTTTGEGLVANSLNLVSSAAVNRGAQGLTEQNSLGFYVQEQVGWKNRLFATAAVRVDDNSAFGKDFSMVVYPKAQLSYVISDEEWFDYGFVDQLKLRAAWGQAGNPPDPFVADRTYDAGVTTVGDQVVNLLRPSEYGNPNLKAETGSEIEVGFESSHFDGRLGIEFTYYSQHTRDALLSVPAPRSAGFDDANQLLNVGEIANSGLELLVTATPVYTRHVQWDATVSVSTNKNELVNWGSAPLTEIDFGSFATVQRHKPGYPMGGYWTTDVVRDANGAPVLTNGNVTVRTDKEYLGPSSPTREIGTTHTFTIFDNFRLFANLDYKGGNYQWNAIGSVRNRNDLNTWLANDPNGDPVEKLVARSLQTKTWVKEADFVKLRELSLTYQFPSGVAERLRFESASVTVAARNLWMWTKYDFGEPGLGSPDPEVSFNSGPRFERTDYCSIPMLRSFAASLRFSF
ncbi:MAG TPA: SusC/RagA family TonB-linked outer membrane protein [Longimicrobiales bacterium]|nr:SusC/RagA family TonB-linked outer membrane protein [Longimicrobiales bacterium]